MSLTFGPTALPHVPASAEDVVVTRRGGAPVTFTDPVTVDGEGRVSFAVADPGAYTISVSHLGTTHEKHAVLAPDAVNLWDMGSIRAVLEDLVVGGVDASNVVKFVDATEADPDPDRPDGEFVIWRDFRETQTTAPSNMGQTDVWLTGFEAGSEPPPEDTEAPSVPTGLAESGVTDIEATITWSAATDNVGVTHYEWRVDGGSVTEIPASPRSVTLSGLTAETAYDFEVRAKDANDNVSATWALYTVTTSAASGGLPTHTVFDTPPGTLVKTVESEPYEWATGFYTYGGATGWKVKGARVYVPEGVTVPSTAEINLYTTVDGASAPVLGSPTKTVTMTGITSGQWNTVNFPSVTAVDPGDIWWIGVKFPDGTWLGVTAFSEGYVQAADLSTLVLADRVPNTGLNRIYQRIGTGSTIAGDAGHIRDVWYGMDAVVEEDA